MSQESHCRCLLCGMERQLAGQFAAARGHEIYRVLSVSCPVLSSFAAAAELVAYLHAGEHPSNGRYAKDRILAELLGGAANTEVQELLLLVFVPLLHSTARHIATRYPLLPEDDIAQHVVTELLEILVSREFSRRDSHIAFAAARLLRRNAFTWAERECRAPSYFTSGEAVTEMPADGPEPIERMALLRHFLDHCRRHGILSDEDLDLLVQFKLDDAPTTGYSNAARQRMKRLLGKLRRAARRRQPDAGQLRLF